MKLTSPRNLKYAIKTKSGYKVLDMRKSADRKSAMQKPVYLKDVKTGKAVKAGLR